MAVSSWKGPFSSGSVFGFGSSEPRHRAWKTAIYTSGTNPQAAGQTPEGDFTVSQTFQDDKSLSIVFADSAVFTMADRRFVARGLNGQEHQANGVNASATRNVILRSVKFAGLTQQDVRDIRYDMRPYTDFVEFSNVSTQPGAITKPQVSTGKINPGIIPADNPGPGEYYVGGAVLRVGVYSLSGREITVKQAVVSAGLDINALENLEVTLIRRLGDDQERITTFDLAPLFAGTQPDRFLQSNDVIQVTPKPLAALPAELESRWADLLKDEPTATRAALDMAKHPDSTT